MIAYLTGNLLAWNEEYLIVDVNGVGYQVFTPTSTFTKLPAKGEEVSFHVHTAVREDAITLYGFLTMEELELFQNLISVNKVGPKVALATLSTDVRTFKKAIVYEDIKTLKKIPGIGQKTAQRLILELQSKIELPVVDTSPEDGEGTDQPVKSSVLEEAVEALEALGYSRSEALDAVKEIKGEDNVQEVIRQALKILGQGRS